jgi:hypothetical protein
VKMILIYIRNYVQKVLSGSCTIFCFC